jgi:hypothetical protein
VKKFFKIIAIVGVAVVLLIAALVGRFIFVVHEAELYQERLGQPLERELGFQHGSPYIRFGSTRREVFTLHPAPDGVLARAGVRDGDIPIDFSITGFYKHLYRSRGSQVTVRLMDGSDGPPKSKRAIRTATFYVPAQ